MNKCILEMMKELNRVEKLIFDSLKNFKCDEGSSLCTLDEVHEVT